MVHRLQPERGWFRGPKTREFLTSHPEVSRGLKIAKYAGLTRHQFDRLPSDERDDWAAAWAIEQGTCSDCGNPVEECSDPDRVWYPYRRICYATLERETAQAALRALRKDKEFHDGSFTRWSTKRSAEFPCPEGAGETVGVAREDLTPWDEFTTKLDASPTPPPTQAEEPTPQEAPGQTGQR